MAWFIFSVVLPWPELRRGDEETEEEKVMINKVALSPNGKYIGKQIVWQVIGDKVDGFSMYKE